MRADRLVAIVLLLQSHGQLTAVQLAEMLETSERTIRRDLDSLSMAGVPVYSLRGRHGGWALLGDHKLNLSGFTVEEARALFLVAGSQASGMSGVEPGLRSALRKVLAALPEPLRDHVNAAESATVIDPVGWGRTKDEPALLDQLSTAVLQRVQADIRYAKPGREPEWRRVHPLGLVAKGGIWYLLAGTAGGRRTFRVSRVIAIQMTDDPVELPEGFDLSEEWSSAQRDFAVRMGLIEVEIEIAEQSVLALTSGLRGWTSVEVVRPIEGVEARRLVASFPNARAAAAHLAAFGGDVRVLSPPDVRSELLRIGEALVEVNANAGAEVHLQAGQAPAEGVQRC